MMETTNPEIVDGRREANRPLTADRKGNWPRERSTADRGALQMSVELMQYLPDPSEAGQGARKYSGEVAQGYDQKREDSPKWQAEQSIVESMLNELPFGSWILDCPCGTGRFFEFYHKKNFLFRAIDASADMLRLAAQKVVDPMKARLAQADIRALPLDDKSV